MEKGRRHKMESKLDSVKSLLMVGKENPELNIGQVEIQTPSTKITFEEAEYFHEHGVDVIVDADNKRVSLELSN
jgi:hypothetical protein